MLKAFVHNAFKGYMTPFTLQYDTVYLAIWHRLPCNMTPFTLLIALKLIIVS